MSRILLLALLSLIAACGGSRVTPISVNVEADAPASLIATIVRQAAAGAGVTDSECFLLWGEVTNPPRGARPASLNIGGELAVDGWLACGEAAIDVESIDPRVHQIVMIEWDRGEMRGSHPSGPGSTPIVVDEMSSYDEHPLLKTFAMFGVRPSDDESTAAELLPALRALPEGFIFVEWGLY